MHQTAPFEVGEYFNSSGSTLDHGGLDDSKELDIDGSDTSGGGSDKGNVTFPILKKSKSSKGIKASLSQIFKKNRKMQVADSDTHPDYNSSMHRSVYFAREFRIVGF